MSDELNRTMELDPANPGQWLDDGYERLFAMSWRSYENIQIDVIRRRFDELNKSVSALERLSKREGIAAIDDVSDVLPLLFDHRVYKSYPLSLIEQRDIPKLNRWLDRLTSRDLSGLKTDDLTMVDEWLDRLDENGMLVGHSSGTSGKLSFIPRSSAEFSAYRSSYFEASRASSGIDPWHDHLPTFYPGYRSGHQMAIKMVSRFNIQAAGGADNYYTLYPGRLSADLMSLAGRMQVAEDRGELAQLGLAPALVKARADLMNQAKRRDADLEAFFATLIHDFKGKRVKIAGTFPDLVRIAQTGIEKGLKPGFAPDSLLAAGGGMKGVKNAPADWETYVKDYFGIDRVSMSYGMSEGMGFAPRCSEKNFHILPHTVPFMFDADTKLLPRTGSVTGRYGFFDLQAETYWGGFITGDQITMHWDEDCACGWKGPRIGPVITRFADLEGGDEKISCAGTAQAYNDLMNFVSEV